MLKRAFDAFAQDKGFIETNMVGTILQMLGHDVSEDRLQEIIAEVDADGKFTLIKSNYPVNNVIFITIYQIFESRDNLIINS